MLIGRTQASERLRARQLLLKGNKAFVMKMLKFVRKTPEGNNWLFNVTSYKLTLNSRDKNF